MSTRNKKRVQRKKKRKIILKPTLALEYPRPYNYVEKDEDFRL